MQQAQGLGPCRRFQQGLLLGHVQAEHRADQVGQAQRIAGLGGQLVDVDVCLGLRQLEDLAGQLEHGAVERLDLGAGIVGEAAGRGTRALRYGSVCSTFSRRRARCPGPAISIPPSPRAIFLMTACVPTV